MNGRDPMEPARASSTKLTYADFLLFPDDGQRHELIDGEHYVTPSPSLRHQQVQMRLIRAFVLYLEDHALGELFAAPFDVVFSDLDVGEPDLLFVASDQLDILTPEHVRGAPALVIEIQSPGTSKVDEQTKQRLYGRAGVKEYWIVDPELDVAKVHRRTRDGSFPRVAELSREEGHALTTPLLPEFAVRLDDLFR